MIRFDHTNDQDSLIEYDLGSYRPQLFGTQSSQLTPSHFHTSAHIKAMSESLAAFRPNRTNDLKQLAEEHLQHE
jgi:hypothetical protein